ncbi:hypothetical protein CB0940_08232 [Cercospora beticola]|uniref:Uncharacterized protein n=1 Tax=Cercospora beticola TaxID=122368 RepID=A0A2G5HP33_CERBT|nr:hypothetical protein CB0940_08232 [Cercospora beticola]PIA94304.1 hypothetical protein CB0940_08232 [Cercospora beticola]WPB04800.1 hypothetical protein RHO25_009447 [Cercospora beticola]
MLWLWLSSLLVVHALPKYDFSTRPDVVAAARGLSTGFGKRLSKRQQAWTGYPSYYYDTSGWPYQGPYQYSNSYYYPQYYDPYSYYYPRPSTPPLRDDLGPNPPYESPKSSYNPCADPDSVNWTVECNGGGSQKTTKIDGGAHSLQETNTFFTWKYGPKSPFNQPFSSVGNPSLNGKFSGDSNDNDNTNCVGGIDQFGNPCTDNSSNGNNNDGGDGGDCVGGLDSLGNACGDNNNNNNNNNNNGGNGGNDGGDCTNGFDSNGNACGGGDNNNGNGNGNNPLLTSFVANPRARRPNGRNGRNGRTNRINGNGGNGNGNGGGDNNDDNNGLVAPNLNTATNANVGVNPNVNPNIAVNLQR